MDGLIKQWGTIKAAIINFPISFENINYSINMNTSGILLAQGGSSFDAREGRSMSCNIYSADKLSCTIDYGLGDVGTAYSVLWTAKGY